MLPGSARGRHPGSTSQAAGVFLVHTVTKYLQNQRLGVLTEFELSARVPTSKWSGRRPEGYDGSGKAGSGRDFLKLGLPSREPKPVWAPGPQSTSSSTLRLSNICKLCLPKTCIPRQASGGFFCAGHIIPYICTRYGLDPALVG